MKRSLIVLLAGLSLGVVSAGAMLQPPASSPPAPPTVPEPAAQAKPNSAVVPVSKNNEEWWKKLNESFDARAKEGAEKGDIDVIFLGDSITFGWQREGAKVWDEFYGKRHAVNFGIGGDRTQHVLWRVLNGNLDGLAHPRAGHSPRLLVLMIGTNNSNGHDNTAEEIGAGIRACVAAIREKLPDTKVLLLSVFPRGEHLNPQREKNARASRIAAGAADNKTVFSMDIGDKFLEPDGTLTRAVMPDLLHLSEDGYRRWAAAIEPKVREILGNESGASRPHEHPAAGK